MTAIHAIILTLNESQHIRRCIESLGDQCETITVVDSGSKDDTCEIAASLGADVIKRKWINYARQLNHGIDHVAERGGWLLRIDADEVVGPETCQDFKSAIEDASPKTDGLLVDRHVHFLGRRIRWGSLEPNWQLRLWRNGRGRCELRWMDEHILVERGVEKCGVIITDINLNSLTWWVDKHNNYASREAIDVLGRKHGFLEATDMHNAGASGQAKIKRFMKFSVYMKLPGAFRAFLYFIYRYIFRAGFLDGVSGLYFHVLQGFWYRTLVDAKLKEIEDFAAQKGVSIEAAILDRTGFDPHA